MSPFARELFRRISLGLPLASVGPGSVFVATLATRPPGAPPVGAGCAIPEPRTSAALECQRGALLGLGGRAPSGLHQLTRSPSSLGEHFARAAWFEAASVFAFEDLAHELGMHGAPWALVQRAWAAAKDERRHARIFSELAASEGVAIPPVERTASRPRTLRALAEDNATEGLGREAFATLVATHQARHATDRRIARASASIVPDEAQHALLSADVHAWAVDRLGRGIAAACDEVRRALLADLVEAERPSALDASLGLPDRATRARFAVALS